jgi:hypothetical protein
MNEKLLWMQKGVTTGSSDQIELSGIITQGVQENSQIVVINYTLIPGNNPVVNGNWAGFWWDNGGNFWEGEPIAWAKAGNATSRQIIIPLHDLIYGIYHVRYYCDQKDQGAHGAPSATLSFPGVTQGKNPFSCSIVALGYEGGSLKLSYATPVGNNPAQNANLIALWEGAQPQWDCSWQKKLANNSTQASGQLDWTVSLKPGATYTLAYMNGTGCQNIAASSTFTLTS